MTDHLRRDLSRRLNARRRQSGALLLTVALMLATIAALAFTLNRAAGMDAQAVGADYDRRSAAYLAEAALAAAKWSNEIPNKCGNANLGALSLAGATLSADVKKAPSKRLNIVATATTATGASATLARNEVELADLTNAETKDLGGTSRDTYIDRLLSGPVSLTNGSNLALASNQQHALLYWPTSDIPQDAAVLSARLLLTQNGSSGTVRTVNLHRMTASWENSATWTQSRGGVLLGNYWTRNGGDYSAPVLASTKVTGAGSYSWDVTGLVDGWVSGRLLNYGMLLRLQDDNQFATFYSLEASSSSNRPVLRVTFAKSC